jgi:predicted lipid-binding transport protein (Tim44 family)
MPPAWDHLLSLLAQIRPTAPEADGAGSDLSYLGWLCPMVALSFAALGLAAWYGQRKAKERVGSLKTSLVDEVAARRAVGRVEDAVLSPHQIADRVRRAEEQLAACVQQDTLAEPAYLREWTKEVFRLLQRCRGARDYGPVQALLSWDLYGQFLSLLKDQRARHEAQRVEDVELERLELVEAVAPVPAVSFTALITFRARSYVVDDLTQAHRRGSKDLRQFQECWTFQRQGDVWLLSTIEKSKGR